jgi:exonuclease SbcC
VRPIRLDLQGFTSFREHSEVNFEKLDLFAITGPTGAGKSSLLDAITYALYGRTSRLGKSGKELISQGAPSLQLTFEFKAGTETYQVFRRVKVASVTVRLEKKEPDGTWASITSAVKQMEEEIERVVGLDFDAFTRAVILPQGEFDKFLRGDSAKRKLLLSELLNMGVYRKMMQQANLLDKEQTQKADWAEQHVDASISEQSLAGLTEAKAELEGHESERQAELTAMEKARPVARELTEWRTHLHTSQQDAALAEAERETAESQLAAQAQTKNENNACLEKLNTEIQSVKYNQNEHLLLVKFVHDAERLGEIRGEISRCERQSREFTAELDHAAPKTATAEAELQKALQLLESAKKEHESVQREYSGLLAHYGSAKALDDLRQELQTYNKKIAARAAIDTELRSLCAELEMRDETLNRITRRGEQAEAQLNMADTRLETISLQNRAADLRRQLHPGDSCPVCEQTVTVVPETTDLADLDEAKREQKRANKSVIDCTSDYQKANGRFELLSNKVSQKEQELRECSDSITDIQDRFNNALGSEPGPGSPAQIDALALSLDKARLKADELVQSVENCRKIHSQWDRKLHDGLHAVDLIQQKLDSLQPQLQVLQRQATELTVKLQDRPGLETLKKELKHQETAKIKMEDLVRQCNSVRKDLEESERTAIALRTRADEAAKRLEKAIAATAEAEKKEQSQLKKLRRMLGDAPLTEGRELDELDETIHNLNEALSSVRMQIERNRAETENVIGKLKKNQELREEAAAMKKSAALYHELATLLDLKNFQQYLLSASFIRLARDGSRYMEDLTNGRYSFTCNVDDFEVQDRWNGDDLRSVSTLSGGEAFLASLSLALALAQGITELSGDRGAVALESLFLDEGFSTLDSETLGKVADALPLLQKSGRMIGVITHVQSFAEQLPSQIEVVKTPTGSRVVAGKEPSTMSAGV